MNYTLVVLLEFRFLFDFLFRSFVNLDVQLWIKIIGYATFIIMSQL